MSRRALGAKIAAFGGLDALASRAAPYTYQALRIVAGVLFAFHGAQKLFGLYGRAPVVVGSQLWTGAVIELVCGGLVALGLAVRPAAFLASGTMAVAYTQFHWKLGFAQGAWLPAVNKGELALVFAFLFLFFAARGKR